MAIVKINNYHNVILKYIFSPFFNLLQAIMKSITQHTFLKIHVSIILMQ
jgi:hypothetical protein